jgi:hypothetical protein
MTRITLDNGDVVLLEEFNSATLGHIEHLNSADTESIRLTGIGSAGDYDNIHDQSSPQAIRTIEFLP